VAAKDSSRGRGSGGKGLAPTCQQVGEHGAHGLVVLLRPQAPAAAAHQQRRGAALQAAQLGGCSMERGGSGE
jgi:hypothetical protein